MSEVSVRNVDLRRRLKLIWTSPLQYWRAITKGFAHSTRPSGPRERLLRRCREKSMDTSSATRASAKKHDEGQAR